jgi:hypothetical protein
MQRAVAGRQASQQADAREMWRQVATLHDLGGEAVFAQRGGVAVDVEALLDRGGEPEAADAAHGVPGADRRSGRVHLLLCRERPGIELAGRLAPVAVARIDVERRGAGEQEAAVAAAGARRDGPLFQHGRAQPVLGEAHRAGQAADAGPDHAHVEPHGSVEWRAGPVGPVEPVRDSAFRGRRPSVVSAGIACHATT